MAAKPSAGRPVYIMLSFLLCALDQSRNSGIKTCLLQLHLAADGVPEALLGMLASNNLVQR